jgi:hypothetical protein
MMGLLMSAAETDAAMSADRTLITSYVAVASLGSSSVSYDLGKHGADLGSVIKYENTTEVLRLILMTESCLIRKCLF